MMIKIWGRRNSLNVQKVLWLIGELSIAYEHIPAGGDFGGLDTPQFLAINPHGRIPVIQDDDGTIVWESHAILRYMAACYGTDKFWSNDARIRSQSDRWMDWAQTTLQPDFLTGVFWGLFRTPENKRNLPAIYESIKFCNQHFQLLNNVLSNQLFLAGDTITLADIPAGTMLYRYFNIEIERPNLPNVEGWYKRLQSHTAYRDHVMVPFDELKGRENY